MTNDDNHVAKGICPSPSGEVRWGLMTILRVVSIGLELSLNFISFVVYPCLSWFLSKYSVLALCPQPSAWTQIKKMKH